MTMTKREYDQASAHTDRITSVADVVLRVFGPVLRFLFKFGPLGRTAGKSVGGRVGAISRHGKRGEYDKAVALAIDALKTYRHQKSWLPFPTGQDLWWMFMTFAAENLEERDDPDRWDELLELARNGVEPFEGYNFAQSQLAFSRWKYRSGDHDAAVVFAETASRADPTWGEPDFMLGWYCMALGGGDALAHLTMAVGKDSGILFRIASDPLCRQHPHIIQRLKELSASEIVTTPD